MVQELDERGHLCRAESRAGSGAIHDNIIIVEEVVHSFFGTKGKYPSIIVKQII